MVKKIIPHVRLTLGPAELEAVAKVLKSGYLAPGLVGETLERGIARLSNQKSGVAVSSGTAALHVALLALGVKAGDEVIIPAYSCQALLNAVLYVGARPVVVDIDLSTFNIDPQEVQKNITKKTKAIIVPHMFGLMADIVAIKRFSIPIIEDCALSIGAKFKGQPAGSFGVVAIFSFYATKTITGGEGGMVVSSVEAIVDQARDVREYDKKKNFIIRYNYKLSDVNAAIALAQLKQLPSFVTKRQAIAKKYTKALAGTNFILPTVPVDYHHTFSRYIIRTPQAEQLRTYLKDHGVGTGRGVVLGIHELIKTKASLPKSKQALREAVSLPIYPTLTASEQQKIITLLINFKS